MKKNITILSILLTFNFLTLANKILIIDTYSNESYSYNNFVKNCKTVELNVDIFKFFEIQSLNLSEYQYVFLLASIEFLDNQSNQISQDIIELLTLYIKDPNKTIGLIFPAFINDNQFKHLKITNKAFERTINFPAASSGVLNF